MVVNPVCLEQGESLEIKRGWYVVCGWWMIYYYKNSESSHLRSYRGAPPSRSECATEQRTCYQIRFHQTTTGPWILFSTAGPAEHNPDVSQCVERIHYDVIVTKYWEAQMYVSLCLVTRPGLSTYSGHSITRLDCTSLSTASPGYLLSPPSSSSHYHTLHTCTAISTISSVLSVKFLTG